jgi:hypothetical protein
LARNGPGILRTDAKRHRVGFVNAKDLKPRDRFVLEEDQDLRGVSTLKASEYQRRKAGLKCKTRPTITVRLTAFAKATAVKKPDTTY